MGLSGRVIVVLSGFWPTEQNPITGIFVQKQVEAFIKRGCRVRVVVPQAIGKPSEYRPTKQSDEGYVVWSPWYLRMPRSVLPSSWSVLFNSLSCQIAIQRVMRKVCQGLAPDVLQVHGLLPHLAAIPAIQRQLNVPCVATLHGRNSFLEEHSDEKVVKDRLQDLRETCSRVVAVSENLRMHLSDIGLEKVPQCIIPNGTNIPAEWRLEKHSDHSHGEVLFVSISNLVKIKGIDLNIKGLARLDASGLSNFKYTVIGDGPERDRLEALSREVGIRERVTFLGRLPHDETMAILSRADVMSLPSRREAFGIVYIEAMARGVPVVGCRQTGASEILNSGEEGFLVRAPRVDEVEEALRQLYQDAGLRKQFGIAGRRRAYDFSWDKNTEQYIELYNSLTGQS